MKQGYRYCILLVGLIKFSQFPNGNKNYSFLADNNPLGDYGGTSMKKLTVTILIAICIIMTSMPAFGNNEGLDTTVDILLVRPVSLAATVVGMAVFIVSLPFSIPSQSVGSTAKTLVAEPFNYTFTRPIGEFSGERMRGKAPSGELQSPTVEKGPETDGSSNQ
jgi:hypothetical protein